MLRTFTLLISLIILPGLATAASDYYVGIRTGVDLLKKPNSSSKIIQHLPRLTDVEIVAKRRTWQKIKVTIDKKNSLQGWVPVGAIRKRYQPKHTNSSPSAMSSFLVFFKPKNTDRKTAVLGVRGLDSEANLGKASQSSMDMVSRMEALQVSPQDVTNFVHDGDLNP